LPTVKEALMDSLVLPYRIVSCLCTRNQLQNVSAAFAACRHPARSRAVKAPPPQKRQGADGRNYHKVALSESEPKIATFIVAPSAANLSESNPYRGPG
jgi:hypothetical protein